MYVRALVKYTEASTQLLYTHCRTVQQTERGERESECIIELVRALFQSLYFFIESKAGRQKPLPSSFLLFLSFLFPHFFYDVRKT